MSRRILLLAGSAEAREIASALTAQGDRVQALVSEAPRGPNPMPVPTEMHDFSCASALAVWMAGADAVVDASHGFDGRTTSVGYAAATAAGRPFVSLSRLPWGLEATNWRTAPDVASAMAMIDRGARVFSTTGWASLPAYAGFPGAKLLLRQTAWHERLPPFGFVEAVFGDPPFTLTGEITLFRQLRVDMLICRNLGGLPSRPKLEAAKALNLPVILIDRPPLPDGAPVVNGVSELLDWLTKI